MDSQLETIRARIEARKARWNELRAAEQEEQEEDEASADH